MVWQKIFRHSIFCLTPNREIGMEKIAIEDLYRQQLNKHQGYHRIQNLKAEIKARKEDYSKWEANFDHVNLKGRDCLGREDNSIFNTGRELRLSMIHFFEVELERATQIWYDHLRGITHTGETS